MCPRAGLPRVGGVADNDDDWLFDDDDAEAWLAEWEEADRQAAEVLREACPIELASGAPRAKLERAAAELREGLAGTRWPFDYFLRACGWSEGDLPQRDVDLWISALASSISPPNDPGIDVEQASAVAALLHADWLGLVVGLVRRGAGAEFSPEAAMRDIDTLPELEGDIEDPDGHLAVLSTAVTTLAPLWRCLGVLDDDDRLTELGRWGLPNALLVTWSVPDADEAGLDGGPGGHPDQLDEAAAEIVLDVLARRPMTLDALRREVAKEGVFASADQLSASIIWRPEVFEFIDGVWAHIPTLANDLLLTHRLGRDEVELGVLAADLDLDFPALLALDGHPLAGGGTVKARYRIDEEPLPGDAHTGLVGPEGWLAEFADGDLLGLRYVDGELVLEKLDLPPEDETRADVEAVVDAAREAAELDATEGDPADPGVSGVDIALGARRSSPRLFARPLPPLSEILAGVEGLEVEHGFVGVAGTAWHGEPSWLDERDRSTYRVWRGVLDRHRKDGSLPDASELGSLAKSLGDELLSLVAFDLTIDPDLEPVAVAMAEAVTDRLSAVPSYLRACAAEGRGDADAWLAHLEAAVAADPQQRDALGDLADLRSVTGDAREAHRLYGLAGLDTSTPELQIVGRFLQPPEGTGRNKPCPCGSGKKYKVCHGRTDAHPLVSRGPWLWLKLYVFAQRGVNREVLLDWAELLADAPRESREAVARAMDDPLVVDLAAFDGGLLERFLEVLGPLLPDDERDLAASWVGAGLRLMEVQQVRPMRGVGLRDLVTGEQLQVLDRLMTTNVEAKDLVLGRPMDDGAGDLRFQASPLSIPRLMRSRLLALFKAGADAEEVAHFLGAAGRRPEVRTTEDEELVMCTARYELSSADEAWAALAAEMVTGGADELLDEVEIAGRGTVVRGRVHRAGSRLTVEANAIERLRRIQERVLAADPGARLVDESTRPIDDLLSQGESEERALPSSEPGELDPEVIEQVVRQQEANWVDGPVPALHGRTPRAAAQDPALREELIALLDDFEWQDRRNPGPFGMDVDRLRRELGIGDERG